MHRRLATPPSSVLQLQSTTTLTHHPREPLRQTPMSGDLEPCGLGDRGDVTGGAGRAVLGLFLQGLGPLLEVEAGARRAERVVEVMQLSVDARI